MIGNSDTFTLKYSSEKVYATVVTNELNQIQNHVPPIALVAIPVYNRIIVEDFTDVLSVPTNLDNIITQKKHFYLQCVFYFLLTNTNYFTLLSVIKSAMHYDYFILYYFLSKIFSFQENQVF